MRNGGNGWEEGSERVGRKRREDTEGKGRKGRGENKL